MKYSFSLLLAGCISLASAQENPFGFKTYEQEQINNNRSNEDTPNWLKRWENFQVQRLKANGELINDQELYQTLQETQQNYSRVANNVSWYPGGPSHDYGDQAESYKNIQVGRVNTIAFDPYNKNTYYVGVAQGGIWKTTNDAQSWIPLTDDLPTLRVSDIAVDPLQPDTLYACLGDYAYLGVALHTDDRKRHTHYGIGVYKSYDGGSNWSPTGLTFEQIGADNSLMRRLFINPDNNQSLIAGGISGVWTSNDGGDSWTNVLDIQVSDFEQDPNNKNVLYVSNHYNGRLQTGEPAIYKSTNFGQTWTKLNTSSIFEATETARIEIDVAPSNSNYIYALAGDVDSDVYGIFRSTDGGTTWSTRLKNSSHEGTNSFNNISGQTFYDLALLVDPQDEDRIYFGGLVIAESQDGGQSYEYVSDYGNTLHPDQHLFEYNPLDNKFYICNDGGLVRTDEIHDNYCEWQSLNNHMQTTSFYRLSVAQKHPEFVMAGAQDNNTHYGDTSRQDQWDIILGGDGMECIINPDNDIFYASYQYGNVFRSEGNTQSWRRINPNGETGEWVTPYLLAPNDPNTVYGAWGDVYRSTNKGDSWTQLTNFSNMNGASNPSPASALAVNKNGSKLYVAKRIYHSYNEPTSLHRSHDSGSSWEDITFPNMEDLYITYLSCSEDGNTLWVSLGGFEDGEKIYRSDDGGDLWQNVSLNLPNLPVNCIITDHRSSENLVYVGTDRGVYYKTDTIQEWVAYGQNLPNVIVGELELNEQSNKLYAATFGRGIWIAPAIEHDTSIGICENKKEMPLNAAYQSNSIQLNRSDLQEEGKIELIDVMGRKVYSSNWRNAENSIEIPVSTEGVYFIRYQSSKREEILKVKAY